MGIRLNELLALEYFKDFHVLAGRKGLDKKVQGVAVMDAPDSLRWAKGKELILTSGYSIAMEPDCIKKAFEKGSLQISSALVIKRMRHLDRIPQDIIDLCEEHDFPLISMPYEAAYMDVMYQVNIAVLNRTTRSFQIQNTTSFRYSRLTYKEQQINKILKAVENEMDFPAYIYDISEDKGYYSSPNFKAITQSFGLKESDYWNPSMECTKYTLCDYIHMVRYRLIDVENPTGPRISWILIPIMIGNQTKAFFIVMESKVFIDYYDEYAIRIAYIMLKGAYEQIAVAESLDNIGFENFVLFALNNNDIDSERLNYQAHQQGISATSQYYCIGFQIDGINNISADAHQDLMEMFRKTVFTHGSKLAFLDENTGMIFLEESEYYELSYASCQRIIRDFEKNIKKSYSEISLKFGCYLHAKPLTKIKDVISKCRKVIQIGNMIWPERNIWNYDDLGPLVWLQIPEDEFMELNKKYSKLFEDERTRILLQTLKCYLENNMNYSVTADKMFVHVNTIRKRISHIDEILEIDWDDPISRLKTNLMLQLLKM